MTMTVQSLCHYPVKGLSGRMLNKVALRPGEGFPLDRVFGFTRPDSGFDPDAPLPLSKDNFHVLMMDPALALLNTSFDDATGTLTIAQADQTDTFQINDPSGRVAAAQYIQNFLNLSADQQPTLHAATPHRFTDVSVTSAQMMNAVSLINQASVDAFATQIGAPVDPARFRGNIVFAGMPAFAELDLVGQTITVGEVQMRVLKRTKRCAATEVNLTTGERDIKVPYLLRKVYGHTDMGIYAEVVTGGAIQPGDIISL